MKLNITSTWHTTVLCFQKMELINQDVLEIEKNLKNIKNKAGPMEGQLATLLQSLPKPDISTSMETD